jgi:hypothetical protein
MMDVTAAPPMAAFLLAMLKLKIIVTANLKKNIVVQNLSALPTVTTSLLISLTIADATKETR